MKSACSIAVAAAAVVVLTAPNTAVAGGPTLFEPGESAYLSYSDSPFAAMPDAWEYSFLENFESGLLSTPGVSISAGSVIGPAFNVDSVDFDDGVIDGNGNAGHSWFVGGAAGVSVRFDFDVDVLGSLPSHAGIVWTDGANTAEVTFTAFDTFGDPIASISDVLGDSNPQGSTAEDRFLGIASTDGIASFVVSTSMGGIELDHLQYGAVTIPAPAALATLAGFGLLGRRRRRA